MRRQPPLTVTRSLSCQACREFAPDVLHGLRLRGGVRPPGHGIRASQARHTQEHYKRTWLWNRRAGRSWRETLQAVYTAVEKTNVARSIARGVCANDHK